MKIQFKHQPYQAAAVAAVVDAFAGQGRHEGIRYRIDPGVAPDKTTPLQEDDGFANAPLRLRAEELLKNVCRIQRGSRLPESTTLKDSKAAPGVPNLDVEMETGTGKTYVYIKTIMELNRQYGWSKFIVVAPSVAIREGVKKSFDMTAEHFQQEYGTQPRTFVYDSQRLHEVEAFSSTAGVQVMIINLQAFNSSGKDNRRIYEALDEFQSRRPIDVIRANRPIVILDEPQKMGAAKSQASLARFDPLFMLRYSATHKEEHTLVHRLDAVDAYNQRLVKRIGVRGLRVRGLAGTDAYLYVQSIDVRAGGEPTARVELEVQSASGTITRRTRRLRRGDNLHELSGGLEAYHGLFVSDIDAARDIVELSNGAVVASGDLAGGDTTEEHKRRLQIREVIGAHLEREAELFDEGVKVLSLFFIDEVVKYRDYSREDTRGDYARIFEEEYVRAKEALLGQLDVGFTPAYRAYLERDTPETVHQGYFSVDKSGHPVDGKIAKTGTDKGQSTDSDAYDLILRDKERLLSLDEPVRFIFSHSALREGWDNPNVFTLGMLKKSDNVISRRQEIGRGLRLAVNQHGRRMDSPADVHRINRLTVVTDESYTEFVSGLQREIQEDLKWRPERATASTFTGRVLTPEDGSEPVEMTAEMSAHLYNHLIRQGYLDDEGMVTAAFRDALDSGTLAAPDSDLLAPVIDIAWPLVQALYEPPLEIVDDRRMKSLPLNRENFEKQAFQDLWARISRKGIYQVDFDSAELVRNAVAALNTDLRVSTLRYTVESGEQKDQMSAGALQDRTAFASTERRAETEAVAVGSQVRYDLLGEVAERTHLTRRTVVAILTGIRAETFELFRRNPEEFIAGVARIVNEQKAGRVIEHLTYHLLDQHHEASIFTAGATGEDFRKASPRLQKHVYDYAVTDSAVERSFLAALEASAAVEVYAKLPSGFTIPTPVGDYNPDWAIALTDDHVKHVFFVAETKGSLGTLDLRGAEHAKIESARAFFAELNAHADQAVRYDAVTSFEMLLDLVGQS